MCGKGLWYIYQADRLMIGMCWCLFPLFIGIAWINMNYFRLPSLQTSRNQMAANFNRFFSECVRCRNTSLRSCFVAGNPSLPNLLLRLLAICGLCCMQLLLLQSVAVAKVLARCSGFVSRLKAVVWVCSARKGLCGSSSSLWPWSCGEVKAIAFWCMYEQAMDPGLTAALISGAQDK